MSAILDPGAPLEAFVRTGGGKATGLRRLSTIGAEVPAWFCVSTDGFDEFVRTNGLHALLDAPVDLARKDAARDFSRAVEARFLAGSFPATLRAELSARLAAAPFAGSFLAVRSSGIGEDSASHSFAGQFSTYLFQRGDDAVIASIERCWASGFSERVLAYRRENGLPTSGLKVGVVVQRMVDPECAGVSFSRNPVKVTDRDHLLVSSVWGLGEGLVSGELDADTFEVHRKTFAAKATLVPKTHAFRRAEGGGVAKVALEAALRGRPSLTEEEVRAIAELTLRLESELGSPQDCEWAIERGKVYCLQTRPVTNLPPDALFDEEVVGGTPYLWDNSNIIESYSGVTSPLTFSFASAAYRQVYIQFCEVVGVPPEVITAHEPMFRNMLGLLRGRIYYNLINWYRLVLLVPGSSTNKSFMETMMGVKDKLRPELASIFDFTRNPPRYSAGRRMILLFKTLQRFRQIDAIVGEFQRHFDGIYQAARKVDYAKMSLSAQVAEYQRLDAEILRRWHAPIINDYLVMVFFGLLKKLTEEWVAEGNQGASLQNDLLCGEGDLESTEPTKTLMRIAQRIDTGDPGLRAWVVSAPTREVADVLMGAPAPAGVSASAAAEAQRAFADFLDRYGFRCVNELKLEEPDLHDDPSFAVNALASYVRMKSYSIEDMEKRERAIRAKAETLVREKLRGVRRAVYFWVLRQARRAVRNRENLRFDRTKIFGVVRHLFRGMGANLARAGALTHADDVFYVTLDELIAFVEGRPIVADLRGTVAARKTEFDEYRRTPPPPDRLITTGAVGASTRFGQVLLEADVHAGDAPVSTDPDVLLGTPCCPGTIEGVVRVVRGIEDAAAMNGEILVTERTDPGWVPLYPSCSGLLIERGSLLSHSAVVARELGLPTIVGVSGGLMKRLVTGDRVRVDAGKGEIRILR